MEIDRQSIFTPSPMTTLRYRIPDEPRPTGMAHLAVDPMWPLLTLMLAGNGIGLLWFAINSRALGSPTAMKEALYIAASLIGCIALGVALAWCRQHALLSEEGLAYAGLSTAALKLGIGYAIYMRQARCAELVQHYGGILRNGAVVAILAMFVARRALADLPLPAIVMGALV
jgi:hypothetical protein